MIQKVVKTNQKINADDTFRSIRQTTLAAVDGVRAKARSAFALQSAFALAA